MIVTNSAGCSVTSAAYVLNGTSPLAGTYTIGGAAACDNYTSFANAATDLNTRGVAGNVTFNIIGGYTETVPAGGLILKQCALAVGLQSGPTQTVSFIKVGGGANPILSANTGTTTANTFTDNIVKIVGMDNVTFNGIDLSENAANVTATTQMEAGLGVYKCDNTNGSNDVTYTNGTITLNKANTAAIGVRVANTNETSATTFTYGGLVGDAAGVQAFRNKVAITNNAITNVYAAVLFNAATAASGTHSTNDTLNTVTGNTITNFGGAATASTVISVTDNRAFSISNNAINSVSAGHTGALTVINGGSGPHGSINNNTISVSPAVTTSAVIGITYGSSGTGNTASISNNTVQNCTLASATTAAFTAITSGLTGTGAVVSINYNVVATNSISGTGTFIGVASTGAPLTLSISNNTINANTKTSTGTMTCFSAGAPAATGTSTYSTNTITYNVVAGGAAASTVTSAIASGATGSTYMFNGNTITNNGITALTGTAIGTVIGFTNSGSATGETITNNQINNLYVGGASTGTHIIRGILNNTSASSVRTVSGNDIHTLHTLLAASAGTITGITSSAGASATVTANKIYDLSAGGSASTITGILNTAGTTVNIQNNIIGDLRSASATGANAILGVSLTGGTTVNASFNTIRLSGSTTGGASGISMTATPATVNLRSNIVYNTITPGGGVLYSVALRRAAAALTQIGASTNNNLYYATGAGSNAFYYDGTTPYATLAAYKAIAGLAPREAASVEENVVFASTTGSDPTFLHFTAGSTSLAESGGVGVSGITTDFDGDSRALTPDIGADEFAGTSIQPAITSISHTPSTTQCVATARAVTAVVTPGALAITGANLSYSYNGGAATVIAMTNTSGNIWDATIPAATPDNAVVTYTITATDGTYSPVASGTSYSDAPLTGVTFTASATPNPICAGSSATLSASAGISGPAIIGAGGTTGTGSYYNPFYHLYGGLKSQSLYTAAELSAAGLTAGNITAVALDVTVVGTVYNSFSLSMGNTALTALSTTLSTGLTSVYSAASVSPTVGTFTIPFSTAFYWNGTSNVIIEYCWSNNNGGGTSTTVKYDGTSNVSNAYYRADSQTPAVICGATVGTGTNSSRAKMTFTGNKAPSVTYAWSDGISSIGTGSSLVVTPAATTTYTATATDANGCTLSATTTVNVNPIPDAPVATNSTQCGLGTPTASVAGAGGNMNWYLASTGGSPLAGQSGTSLTGYPISSTTTFYVAEFDGSCESARTEVIAEVTTPPAVTATNSVVTSTCPFTDFTLTATSANDPNYAYTWTATPAIGSGIPTSVTGFNPTIQATAGGTFVYTVSAVDITSPTPTGCATTATTTVTVSVPPAIDSINATPATICAGEATVLNVYSAGLGSGPQTQPTGYLSSSATDIDDEELLNVTFGTLNNTSTCSTTGGGSSVLNMYSDFTGLVAAPTVTAGASVPFSIQTGTCLGNWTNRCTIYIDWNRDGDFLDANENPFISTAVSGPNTVTGTITVPLTASAGVTRMRVITVETSGVILSTGTYTWGETEDYIVNVIGVAPQDPTKTYAWSPTGGTSATATVNPTSTTTYTVSVNETGNSCTNYGFVTVTVNPLPATPTNNDDAQCGPGIPTCSVTDPTGGIIRWYLTPTGGSPLAGETGTSLTAYSISVPTTFYVSTFNGTCESERVAVFQDVFNAEAVSITATTTGCIGSSVTLNMSEVNPYPWGSYTLNGSTANSGIATPITGAWVNPTSLTVTPLANGTYTYTLTTTDGFCNSVATVVVSITDVPVISSVTASADPICAGTDVTLTALAVGAGPQVMPSGYCVSGSGSTTFADEQIFAVSFGSMTNTQTELCTSNYTDYSGTIAAETVSTGQTVSSSVTADQCDGVTYYSCGLSILIDYNRDGDFADAGETAYTTATTTTQPSTRTGTITIPATATAGLTKMRVVVAESVASPLPCAAYTYTETEDYAVNILALNDGGLTWTWNPSAATGNVVTLNPTTTTTYTVTGTNPASGCSATSTILVNVNPLPDAPVGTPSTQCGTGIPTASVAGAGGTFNWYLAPTGGTAIQTSGSATLTSYSISSTTTFYVSEFDGSCESLRTEVIAEVTPAPATTITASSPSCQNSTVTLTLNDATAFYTGLGYTLNGTAGSGITTPIAGTWASATETVVVTPTGSGSMTYTVTSVGGGCTSVATTTITVSAAPFIGSAVAVPSTICFGETTTLTALTNDFAPGTVNIGYPSTGSIGGSDGNPYRSGNGTGNQIHSQMLVLASELTAAGVAPGPITSLAFTTSSSTGTVSNFTIDMAHTAATSLTTTYLTPTMTNVYSLASFTPVAGLNVHTFSTPFNWNGTSNILINTCQTNNILGTSTILVSTQTAAHTYSATSVTACSNVTGTAIGSRPIMQFNAQIGSSGPGTLTWVWNPGAISGNVATVTPTGTGAQTYTVTATNAGGCTSTADVIVNVNPAPDAPLASAPSNQCGIAVPTVSVTGAGGSYSWYLVPTGGTAIAGETGPSLTAFSISSTTTFYVSEFDGTCNSARTEVIANVTSPDAVSATASSATLCANVPVTLTATNLNGTPINTYSYVWTAAPASGSGIPTSVTGPAGDPSSISVTPTAGGTFTYTVTATDGTCATAATVVVTATAPPEITTATASPSTFCLGTATTLSASSLIIGSGPLTLPGTYCVATGSGSSCVSLVQINTLNSTPAACVSPWYNINAPTGANTTTLIAGQSYTMTLATDGASIISVFIDYNRNGLFEATEWVQPWTNASTGTVAINVPVSASAGLTGMRIRSRLNGNTNGAGDACLAMGSGSTEDYAIEIQSQVVNPDVTFVWNPGAMSGATVSTTPVTTGVQTYTVTATNTVTGCTSTADVVVDVINTPATPTITAAPAIICGSGTVALNVTNATSGASYQWQESASGLIDTWTDVSGANTPSFTTASISASTYYRVYVTCSASGDTSLSQLVTVSNPSIATVTGATRCGVGSVTVSVTGSGSFDWYATSSSITPLATNTNTYTATVTGSTTFWVIAYDGTCLDPLGRQPVNVTVNPAPTVSIASSAGSILCNGTTTTLTASSSNDPNYTYGWSLDGITVIATGATYAVTPSVTTTYYVGALDETAGTFATCQAVASITITVNDIPPVPVVTQSSEVNCNLPVNDVLTATNATYGTTAIYSQTTIPFAPLTGTPIAGPSGDDTYSAAIPIGFSFPFYGANYTDVHISTNGFISFDAGSGAGCCSGQLIPNATTPNNVIAACWTDLNTGAGGTIDYFNLTSPNRFVVNYNGVSHYAGTPQVTSQIVIFEDGTVQIHNTSINAQGTMTQGIEDATGANASAVAGGNASTTFALTNTSYQWTPVPNLYNISWSPSTGLSSTTGSPVTASPTTTTTYTVTYTDPLTGCSNSAPVTVIVTPLTPPTIVASATTICGGSPVTLDAGTGYTSYSWSDGVSVVGTSQVLTVSPTTTTTYTLTVLNGTCQAEATQTINVFSVTPANITSTNGATFCAPGTTTLGVDATFNSYLWSTSETTATITAASSGTYSVTVSDGNSCTQSLSYVVVINPLPPTAVVTASGPTTLCDDFSNNVILSADTTGAGAGASIAWNDFGGGTDNTLYLDANDLTFVILGSPFTFNFTVTNSYGCSAVSNDITVTVVTCGDPMTINLNVFLQGYYLGAGAMEPVLANQGVPGATGLETDTIQVEIYDATTFLPAGSAKAVLMTDGTATAVITGVDGSYYVAVRQRNHILTWSSVPVAFATATPTSYDFTTSPLQAFSSDLADKFAEGIYSLYVGDINQDEFVDGNDYPQFDSDNAAGLCCDYYATDMNGDGFVDGNDYPQFDTNNSLGVSSVHP
ncbi:MAG: hypothetical protein IPH33_19135 [Bacteroidetes bacterium]|nr:hypothetical protein [Bacteroidota bacterium]